MSYVQDFVHYSIIYERLNCAIFGVVGILPLNYHMPYQNYLWVLEDLKLHCAIYNESMIYNLYICRCRLWLDIGTCCFKYVGTGSGTFFFTVFVWAHVLVHFFLQFLFGHRFWYIFFYSFCLGTGSGTILFYSFCLGTGSGTNHFYYCCLGTGSGTNHFYYSCLGTGSGTLFFYSFFTK